MVVRVRFSDVGDVFVSNFLKADKRIIGFFSEGKILLYRIVLYFTFPLLSRSGSRTFFVTKCDVINIHPSLYLTTL